MASRAIFARVEAIGAKGMSNKIRVGRTARAGITYRLSNGIIIPPALSGVLERSDECFRLSIYPSLPPR
jgi:hypothetical protein